MATAVTSLAPAEPVPGQVGSKAATPSPTPAATATAAGARRTSSDGAKGPVQPPADGPGRAATTPQATVHSRPAQARRTVPADRGAGAGRPPMSSQLSGEPPTGPTVEAQELAPARGGPGGAGQAEDADRPAGRPAACRSPRARRAPPPPPVAPAATARARSAPPPLARRATSRATMPRPQSTDDRRPWPGRRRRRPPRPPRGRPSARRGWPASGRGPVSAAACEGAEAGGPGQAAR